MLTPFANPRDVANIWRPLVDQAEEDRVMFLLVKASDQVRDEVPKVKGLSVDERIAAGTLRPETVQGVVVDMVHRLVSVPRYVRQRSVTIDNDTKSETLDASVSSGEMTITDREMARLMGRKGGRPKAFTVTPARCAPYMGRSWI